MNKAFAIICIIAAAVIAAVIICMNIINSARRTEYDDPFDVTLKNVSVGYNAGEDVNQLSIELSIENIHELDFYDVEILGTLDKEVADIVPGAVVEEHPLAEIGMLEAGQDIDSDWAMDLPEDTDIEALKEALKTLRIDIRWNGGEQSEEFGLEPFLYN